MKRPFEPDNQQDVIIPADEKCVEHKIVPQLIKSFLDTQELIVEFRTRSSGSASPLRADGHVIFSSKLASR